MRLTTIAITLTVGVLLLLPTPTSARADGGGSCYSLGCVAKAKTKPTPRHANTAEDGKSHKITTRSGRPAATDFDQHKSSSSAKPPSVPDVCMNNGVPIDSCAVTYVQRPATAPGVTVITITPYQAAVMASAYLPLRPGKPTVGPPPELNRWKMAAVGYPLWIWAEGDLDPAPVSRTVAGLSVSLDASLAKIVYDLGDGTTITCDAGTPWRKGRVAAGAPSPDCGHTYTEPSLPGGEYTITATTYWSVAWTAGGQSGTIPFTQSSTTTLPVGEVQTLVR